MVTEWAPPPVALPPAPFHGHYRGRGSSGSDAPYGGAPFRGQRSGVAYDGSSNLPFPPLATPVPPVAIHPAGFPRLASTSDSRVLGRLLGWLVVAASKVLAWASVAETIDATQGLGFQFIWP